MDSMEHESSPPIYSKPKQRFEISRKLGSGTYGKVSLAMDHKMQEQVAVKIIKKSAIENAQDLLRIRREIRIMSALKHPNIVEIKEVFENHEKIIIVMEYADGGELYDYVSQHGPLPEEEVCKIFRQIVSAIYYCHKHGVCHRDLKLENILLDKNGVAKIADFGLSNYFMDHGLLNTFCGSPLYASPEIINGVPYRGPEVDCWSLGVLLYTLAYSSMPFDGRDFNRMVRQIKKGTYYEPDPPSSASMLIRAMLRVNPERRADIDMIASHWWVNFDENLLPIQDLPENQIIDSTPLNLRNETIIIQNFAEDSDMFSEYSCLSTRTRRKIDEFRRRRHETSDTFSNNGSYDFGGASSSSTAAPAKRLTTTIERNQKSAVGVQLAASHDYANDPLSKLLEPEDSMNDSLQRLKDLELRLITSSNHQPRMHSEVLFNKRRQSKEALAAAAGGARLDQILHSSETENVPEIVKKIASAGAADLSSSATSLQENDRGGGHNQVKNAQSNIINDTHNEAIPVDVAEQSCTSANQEEGNRLVNQLLEEAERGVVGLALIEKIKNHDAYRTQKFVKEIVDSIVEVQQQQKAASARKQSVTKMSAMARQHSRDASLSRSTNKQSNQDAKDLITQNDLPDLVKNQNDQIAQERPPDLVADDKTSSISGKMPTKASIKQDSIHENLQEIEEEDVNSTDFEDLEIEDDEDEYMPPSFEPHATSQDVSPSDSFVTANDSAPKDSNTVSPATQKEESYPPGLSKRLSRGKYEKSKFIYGREVHVEPSPPPARIIRLGLAVQPVPEEAPELFNQAKQYILAYPDVAGDGPSSRKIAWLKTVDPDMGSSQEIEETPPRTPRHSMTGVVEQGGNGYKVLWPPPPTQSAAKNVDSVEGCDDHDTSIDAIVCIKMNGPRHKLSRTYDVGTTTIGLPAFGDVEKSENEIQEPQVDQQVDAANKMNIDGVSFRRPRRPPRRSQLGNQNSLETPLELRQLDEKDKSSLVDVLLSPKNSIDHTTDSTVADRMKHFSEYWQTSVTSYVSCPRAPEQPCSAVVNVEQPSERLLLSMNSCDGKHYAPRPNHDLTADQAVEAAKAYLLHNPDIESERRKHKSWYVGYDEPQQQNNFPDHHQSTFDGYRPSMGASHAFHPEVYQPKSLGSYISPTTTTLHHHTSTDPVDSKSNKFRVFQPKGLLKRRSRSVEKSLEQYAEEEEDGSNTQQTDLLYSHRWKPSTTTHYLENSTHSPLKSILKKASRFDEDHYDPWPDNRYNTPSNYHPMKTDNSQPGALTRLSSNDKLSYLAAEPLISRYSSRDVPPVTIRPYTHDKMDTIVDKTSAVSKKRSLLQHNRRKTTEIRLGTLTEALNSTASAAGSDSPYRNKRAASPFEKIRNIFSKDSVGSSISRTSGEYGGHHPPHHHTTFAGEFSSGVRPSSVYEASVAYNRRGSSNYASGGRTKM